MADMSDQIGIFGSPFGPYAPRPTVGTGPDNKDTFNKIPIGGDYTGADFTHALGATTALPKQAFRGAVGLDPQGSAVDDLQNLGMGRVPSAWIGSFADNVGDPTMLAGAGMGLIKKLGKVPAVGTLMAGDSGAVDLNKIKDVLAGGKTGPELMAGVNSPYTAVAAARRSAPAYVGGRRLGGTVAPTADELATARESIGIRQSDLNRGNITEGMAIDKTGKSPVAVAFPPQQLTRAQLRNIPGEADQAAEMARRAQAVQDAGKHETSHALDYVATENPQIAAQLPPERQAVVNAMKSPDPAQQAIGVAGTEMLANSRAAAAAERRALAAAAPQNQPFSMTNYPGALDAARQAAAQKFLSVPNEVYAGQMQDLSPAVADMYRSGELGNRFRSGSSVADLMKSPTAKSPMAQAIEGYTQPAGQSSKVLRSMSTVPEELYPGENTVRQIEDWALQKKGEFAPHEQAIMDALGEFNEMGNDQVFSESTLGRLWSKGQAEGTIPKVIPPRQARKWE